VNLLPDIIKTDTLVLRARNYRDADQLLSLYTLKKGRLTAIVKGVRKPKSKLRGGVQVFSHTHLCLYLGRSLATVTQTETINTFPALRTDLLRMSYAAYLAEFVESITPEGEADPGLFSLLLTGFHLLSWEDPWLIARLLEVRLLMESGYQPFLINCVQCGKEIKIGSLFVPSLGGVICTDCEKIKPAQDVYKISGETYVVLRQLMQMDLEMVSRLRISLPAKKELEEVLDTYITYLLGKRLKTKEFLNNLA